MERQTTRISLPIDLLRDAIYYLNVYQDEELSCVDPKKQPSKELCGTCPFHPCELVEVKRIIHELSVISLRNDIEL